MVRQVVDIFFGFRTSKERDLENRRKVYRDGFFFFGCCENFERTFQFSFGVFLVKILRLSLSFRVVVRRIDFVRLCVGHDYQIDQPSQRMHSNRLRRRSLMKRVIVKATKEVFHKAFSKVIKHT